MPGQLKRDDGFTLIELLLAIVILGVIAIPLGNLIIGELRNSGPTADRLARSHDEQLSAAFFAQDVASVGLRDYTSTQAAGGTVPFLPSIQLNAAANAGGYTCGTQTALVRFLSDDWTSGGASPQTDVVAYYLLPVGSVDELHRIRCAGGATTPAADVVLAHNVDPATPVVSCSSSCTGTPVPATVTLTFSVTKASIGATQITLTGQRRQS